MNPLLTTQQQLSPFPKTDTFIVGLSGGVDSIVLAHMLKTLGYKLILAHYNHGWRGAESDADEQFVKNLAKEWKLPLEIGRGKKAEKGNAENQARKERYVFLEKVRQKYQAKWIAVAQHQDDQVETILMHQKRGAGLRGLLGIPFQRGQVIRPLLERSKADLIDYANSHQLHWQEDESNQDVSYTRNRFRHVEIPKLKARDPDFEVKLLQKSREAGEKLEELEKRAKIWLKKELKKSSFHSKRFAKLTDELQGEILLQLLGPVDVYKSSLTRLKNWIEKGNSGTRLTVKEQTFWQEHDLIYLEAKNQPKITLKRVKLTPEGVYWGNWFIQNLSDEALFVRAWQPGDRFKPSGMKGSKKVQDFFVDSKIPLHERQGIPLILNKKNVIICISSRRFAQGAEHLKTKLKIIKNEKP